MGLSLGLGCASIIYQRKYSKNLVLGEWVVAHTDVMESTAGTGVTTALKFIHWPHTFLI